MSQRDRLYLICYDITDPKRLNQVARCLQRHACRVQYSVFAAQVSGAHLDVVLDDLAEIIEIATDDVRAYPLPHAGDVALLGRQLFPDDVLLIRHGRNLLRLSPEARRRLTPPDTLAS